MSACTGLAVRSPKCGLQFDWSSKILLVSLLVPLAYPPVDAAVDASAAPTSLVSSSETSITAALMRLAGLNDSFAMSVVSSATPITTVSASETSTTAAVATRESVVVPSESSSVAAARESLAAPSDPSVTSAVAATAASTSVTTSSDTSGAFPVDISVAHESVDASNDSFVFVEDDEAIAESMVAPNGSSDSAARENLAAPRESAVASLIKDDVSAVHESMVAPNESSGSAAHESLAAPSKSAVAVSANTPSDARSQESASAATPAVKPSIPRVYFGPHKNRHSLSIARHIKRLKSARA